MAATTTGPQQSFGFNCGEAGHPWTEYPPELGIFCGECGWAETHERDVVGDNQTRFLNANSVGPGPML